MSIYTEPTTGTQGTIAAFGVTLEGQSNTEPMRATYAGRVPSPWHTLNGEPMADLYALDASDGHRYVFESLRIMLGVWTSDQDAYESTDEDTDEDTDEGTSKRPVFAVHSDGSVCKRAVTTHDCPKQHEYEFGEPIEYTVLTAARIARVLSPSNSVRDITRAVKAAGIDPRTVQAVTAN